MATVEQSDRPRVALILAAGRGTRLLPHTSEVPKCLLDVGGETILAYQVRTFLAAGVEEVLVVIGFQAELVQTALTGQPRVRWVFNHEHATTNSLVSLLLAREAVAGRPFLLCNGDVLFHPQILELLLDAPASSALTMDAAGGRGEEEMKCRVRDGRLAEISKVIPGEASDGENLGLLRFGRRGGELLFAAADHLVAEGKAGQWAPFAYNQVIRTEPIRVVEIGGLPWIEIDTPEDLARARDQVYSSCQTAVSDRG
jgi:choline kinase